MNVGYSAFLRRQYFRTSELVWTTLASIQPYIIYVEEYVHLLHFQVQLEDQTKARVMYLQDGMPQHDLLKPF